MIKKGHTQTVNIKLSVGVKGKLEKYRDLLEENGTYYYSLSDTVDYFIKFYESSLEQKNTKELN